jgi:hypothetical protein
LSGGGKRRTEGTGEVERVGERLNSVWMRVAAHATFEVGDGMDAKPTQRSEAFL